MFAWLRRFGIGDPDGAAKTLNKDAVAILDMIHGLHGAESLRAIAGIIRDARAEVHERSLGNPEFYATGLRVLTDKNSAARRSNDQITWSGLTLTIIYLKAEMEGPKAAPARASIDTFLSEWQHALDDKPAQDGSADAGGASSA